MMSSVKEMFVPVKKLSEESFSPFGNVVAKPLELKPTVSSGILDYWDDIVTLDIGAPMSVGFLIVRRRPFIFESVERHRNTSEMLIPLKGCGILPVASASPLNDPRVKPPFDRMAAFVLEEELSVLMKPGVWHWAPFPVTECASYLVIFKKGTPARDLDIRNLKEDFNITLTLSFKEL